MNYLAYLHFVIIDKTMNEMNYVLLQIYYEASCNTFCLRSSPPAVGYLVEG